MAPLWTAAEAQAATGGEATRDWQAFGVSIDTRTLAKGDLFVALKAERDGHDFVAQALDKGAAAALVSHRPAGVAEDAPLLIVDDVLKALQDLGRAARARTKAKVVAVTGSVGKTSTKEMLRIILGGQGKTHAAEASYNNHWGVPLTLARMPAETDFAVIEIGMNHPGEIAPLAELARPHVAMITTVAPAHLEAFPSVEEIAREKASVFNGLEKGGIAVINADIPSSKLQKFIAEENEAKIVTFGQHGDWKLLETRISQDATVVRAEHFGQPILFKIASPGQHFVMNGLGALAAAEALGADPVMGATDLGRWAPPKGRGARERILLDLVEETWFDLIDDAFNANPASLAAALDVLIRFEPMDGVGRLGEGRRIAILGDMLELGDDELELHAAFAHHPDLQKIDIVHCVGPRMRALYEALPRAQRGEWVEAASALVPRARSLVDAGDVVLLKGSKSIKVSLVVDALRKLGQSAPSSEGNS